MSGIIGLIFWWEANHVILEACVQARNEGRDLPHLLVVITQSLPFPLSDCWVVRAIDLSIKVQDVRN